MPHPIDSRRRSFATVQAGRAIAASLVLLFHTSNAIFGQAKYGGTKPFGPLFDVGDAGVDVFFVISGFVILHAHWRDAGHPDRLAGYVWRRVRRIYPVYWLTLLLVEPAYMLVPRFGGGHETDRWVILSSILLVHIRSLDGILVVSWTLFHEVLFYGLFASVIAWPRFGLCLLAAWFVGSVTLLCVPAQSAMIGFYLAPLHLLFGLGVGMAWRLRRASPIPAPTGLVLAGVSLFVAIGMLRVARPDLDRDLAHIMFGLAGAMALTGAIALEQQDRLPIPKWLRLLGDASYSMYLLHLAALSVLAKALLGYGHDLLPPAVAFVVLAAGAAAVGVGAHWWVERPILNSLGRVARTFGRTPSLNH